MTQTSKRFMSWRDFILTPMAEFCLLLLSSGMAFFGWLHFSYSLFVSLLIFYAVLAVSTLVFLGFLRMGYPITRGVYSMTTTPASFFAWRLHRFLCSTNLFPFYLNGAMPPVLKKFFYQFLGAKMGSGVLTIEGRLLDPYLISIGKAVMIGDDALLMPFHYAIGSSDILVLDQIQIKDGAVIGARSTLMPGVVVGENSMVKPMSYVPINTKIPPNEIWGGNPAKKVADVDKPFFQAA